MTNGFTPETCHERCAAYKFFALQNNGQCFCGNAYGTEPQYVDVDKSECVAEGNGQKDAHFYGDGWRNAVFRNNLYTAPEPAPPEPKHSYTWVGCYVDDGSRDLKEGPM